MESAKKKFNVNVKYDMLAGIKPETGTDADADDEPPAAGQGQQ